MHSHLDLPLVIEPRTLCSSCRVIVSGSWCSCEPVGDEARLVVASEQLAKFEERSNRVASYSERSSNRSGWLVAILDPSRARCAKRSLKFRGKTVFTEKQSRGEGCKEATRCHFSWTVNAYKERSVCRRGQTVFCFLGNSAGGVVTTDA